ncbi:MAG: hypothetical protein A3F12_04785 [Gammaproteobacteria bacterium RIFCSPHIGHO2_12_FULL_38_14]|nr:MAG: hypothetical protein A3F12_04785 [Gammaproteobacteria bacterium RIFCSPHIGHO2_12_FULL_38_14]
MDLLTSHSSLTLWQEVVKHAEHRCSVLLQKELEAYLVTLLNHYTNKPEILRQVFAMAYLDACHLEENARRTSLQAVGDQCLLFTGLFPHAIQRRMVNISYFVDIGRSAYASISVHGNDLYGSLAIQFIVLMDILQSIRSDHDLLPLEAYEQWQSLGSERALKILKQYTQAIPGQRKHQN